MATLVEIAAQIVASHASHSPMTSDELIFEINKVHNALKNLEAGDTVEIPLEIKPAVSPKEAFKKHEVVCMLCGKGGFKTLVRHLNSTHQMKPAQYRKTFNLPAGQSLSAKSYSDARRQMAEDRGLANNLAKAREVRMQNLRARKAAEKGGKGAKSEAPPAAPRGPKRAA